tara:strand:+ start:42796 stop:43389 length:594 start_codon:yes stop_codon:yes gene_type:complete
MNASTPSSCGAILLAAGFSRRFGSIKLNATLPDGSSIFTKSFDSLSQSIDEIIVVGREDLYNAGTYYTLGNRDTRKTLILCEDAQLGMGHSLRAGINAIPDHWSACLICLADMPYINPTTYKQIAENSDQSHIVIPSHDHQRGHPVSFGRQYFDALADSDGDTGGRKVIQTHPNAVLELPVDDKGILLDIDRPEDLA